ncbi:hypothetical protein ATW55_07845 [Ferroacidibacillus organovorans]|uniref:Uncharacterized protein n=1 Tax=Ferroacidibacillus organovorans TaxID=1765683 RepID=A0A117SYC3_9BACL|nr:hypothetical protein ATW55_07845 [Ferroacidibacillus organovorans]
MLRGRLCALAERRPEEMLFGLSPLSLLMKCCALHRTTGGTAEDIFFRPAMAMETVFFLFPGVWEDFLMMTKE